MKLYALDDPRWVEFVSTHPRATLFDHPAWARLLADCYGYRAMAGALTAADGSVTAGVPLIEVRRPLGAKRWLSLPFTDYCPPLADNASELVPALQELAHEHGVGLIELRGPLPGTAPDIGGEFVRHELALSPDVATTFGGLFKNHRRNVRLAERAGVRIIHGSSAEDIDTFYRLHVRTRRRLGVPVQPRRFFQLLLERVIAPGLGVILTAKSGDVPVAAAIFGSWNGVLIYKYSARDERYAKLDANYLLLWTAISWAIEHGHHTFDMGRSDASQPLLRGFKDGWGARELPLSYSWLPAAPAGRPSRRAERAMSLVIRNGAPWVCRAVGELFYRYAA